MGFCSKQAEVWAPSGSGGRGCWSSCAVGRPVLLITTGRNGGVVLSAGAATRCHATLKGVECLGSVLVLAN